MVSDTALSGTDHQLKHDGCTQRVFTRGDSARRNDSHGSDGDSCSLAAKVLSGDNSLKSPQNSGIRPSPVPINALPQLVNGPPKPNSACLICPPDRRLNNRRLPPRGARRLSPISAIDFQKNTRFRCYRRPVTSGLKEIFEATDFQASRRGTNPSRAAIPVVVAACPHPPMGASPRPSRASGVRAARSQLTSSVNWRRGYKRRSVSCPE